MILSTSAGRIKGWKLSEVKQGLWKWKRKWKIEYQKWENEKFMHKQGCEDERAPTIL